MRAASARADVGGIGFRDSERSNIVHQLALISSEPLSIERGSKRTHVPMRNDGMRPALELLASQVARRLRRGPCGLGDLICAMYNSPRQNGRYFCLESGNRVLTIDPTGVSKAGLKPRYDSSPSGHCLNRFEKICKVAQSKSLLQFCIIFRHDQTAETSDWRNDK